MDKETHIEELKEKVKDFCEKRDWDQFHNIKELAIDLSIEVSELLELFRWQNPEEIKETMKNKREADEDEVADAMFDLLRIAQMNNIDLSEALDKKLEKTAKNYPVEKAKGSIKKYNEF